MSRVVHAGLEAGRVRFGGNVFIIGGKLVGGGKVRHILASRVVIVLLLLRLNTKVHYFKFKI